MTPCLKILKGHTLNTNYNYSSVKKIVTVRESQPPSKDDHDQTLDGQKSKANSEASSPKSSNLGLGMNYNTKPTAQVAPTGSTKR